MSAALVGALTIGEALARLRALEGRVVELGVRAIEDPLEVGPIITAVGALGTLTGQTSHVLGGDAVVIGLDGHGDAFSLSCRGEALMQAEVGRFEGGPLEYLRMVVGGLELTVISRLDGEPFDPKAVI